MLTPIFALSFTAKINILDVKYNLCTYFDIYGYRNSGKFKKRIGKTSFWSRSQNSGCILFLNFDYTLDYCSEEVKFLQQVVDHFSLAIVSNLEFLSSYSSEKSHFLSTRMQMCSNMLPRKPLEQNRRSLFLLMFFFIYFDDLLKADLKFNLIMLLTIYFRIFVFGLQISPNSSFVPMILWKIYLIVLIISRPIRTHISAWFGLLTGIPLTQ